MNYLRGALSAASQYYKDLPPINPSTLTGAIDVIVIERPTEDGGSELVCSPFHVRFGKWQVLRPGEKKVKVLVNGHPIPFDMKIGDAGEAFFVFETDEDVPDDLTTSPLLQATDLGESNARQNPPTGRFGAKEDQHSTEELAPEFHESGVDDAPQEPEFLDLNAQPEDKPVLGSQRTFGQQADTSSPSTEATNFPVLSTAGPSDGIVSTTSPNLSQSSNQSSSIPDTNVSVNDQQTMLGSLKSTAATMRDLTTSGLPLLKGLHKRDQDETGLGSDTGDDILPHVDERDIHPPDVTYRHDLVLDVSGYHSKQESEQTVVDDQWAERKSQSKDDVQNDVQQNLDVTPDASRSPSPESIHSPSALRVPRATSEPPEYGPSSSPPPEYSWEWGAFPQRSPIREPARFLSEAPDLIPSRQTRPPPRSRSPIPEADGGRLEADTEDQHRIWLDFEGQRLGFELSLCGDAMHGDVGSAERFDAHRVTFKQLLEDTSVIHSPELVVRWDDEYICRRDNSPLIPALMNWRRRTLSLVGEGVMETGIEPRTSIAPRTSTWSRWWSRSRTPSDVKEASSDKREISSDTDVLRVTRPSLEHTESAPAAPFDQLPSTALQSSVSFPTALSNSSGKKFAKTLRLTSDQLKALQLKKGPNSITFSLSASGQIACTARIFVWDVSDHIVVSDIDGTITKSDALGHVFTMIGRDWTHLGVAKLYTDICRNGYKIMYLTSRAIGQADSTRDYLKGINQNNYQLPEGPVIMSPDRLLTSLHREVIMRKPEMFKMACLRDIQRLFGTSAHNPFYAGFGNRITDALSYRSVNVPSARIFTIDSSGEVKMELLELAGYKSSYIHMTDIVDQMFPPINRKCAPEYTDFNYWRTPVAEYELPETLTAPPSPSLSASARSDTSTQTTLSRLRQFSLGRSSRGQSPEGSNSSSPNRADSGKVYQGGHIRTAASLDRLGSFLPAGNGFEYVHAHGKGRDDDRRAVDDVYILPGEHFRNDVRQGRMRHKPETGSMPGSLNLSMGMQDPRWLTDQDSQDEGAEDEGDQEEEEEDEGDEYAEEAAEEAFDDDLLATGEMETVPFL